MWGSAQRLLGTCSGVLAIVCVGMCVWLGRIMCQYWVTFPPHLLSGPLIIICFPTSFKPGNLSMAGEPRNTRLTDKEYCRLPLSFMWKAFWVVFMENTYHVYVFPIKLVSPWEVGVPWGSLPIFLKT